MERLKQPKTVVLALGNLIRTDDAAGLHALAMLAENSRVPSEVSLVEGGTKGLELVPFIFDADRLLVLDAVDVGAVPGTVFRIEGHELHNLPGSGSVHELALADILNALRIMGRQPEETVLLGIQPATTELGTELSEPVREALPNLVEAAIVELARWSLAVACVGCEAEGVLQSGV